MDQQASGVIANGSAGGRSGRCAATLEQMGTWPSLACMLADGHGSSHRSEGGQCWFDPQRRPSEDDVLSQAGALRVIEQARRELHRTQEAVAEGRVEAARHRERADRLEMENGALLVELERLRARVEIRSKVGSNSDEARAEAEGRDVPSSSLERIVMLGECDDSFVSSGCSVYDEAAWRADVRLIHEETRGYDAWSDLDRQHLLLGLVGQVGKLAALENKAARAGGQASGILWRDVADVRIYAYLFSVALGIDESSAIRRRVPELYEKFGVERP